MSEEEALVAAICADPADDLPRLVYADWLDEQAKTVACEWCKGQGKVVWPSYDPIIPKSGNPYVVTCDPCSGIGRVSDGRAERAEFIRLQCELAKPDPCLSPDTCLYGPTPPLTMTGTMVYFCGRVECLARAELRRRESQLLTNNTADLWFGPEVGRYATVTPPNERERRSSIPWYVIRRGFVHTVRVRLVTLVGEECERCDEGRVPTNTLAYPEDAPESEECPFCPGTGRTPGVLRELVKSQPVEVVEVTDQSPNEVSIHDGTWRYIWRRWPDADAGRPPLPGYLPAAVWDTDHISAETPFGGRSPVAFDTPDLARTALSAGLLALAKSH